MLAAFCCASARYEPISLRKIPYSLDSDVFRVKMKEGDSHLLKKVRVMPEQNVIKGKDVSSGEDKSLSLNRIVVIEKKIAK